MLLLLSILAFAFLSSFSFVTLPNNDAEEENRIGLIKNNERWKINRESLKAGEQRMGLANMSTGPSC